jgi:hypothetical protein
MNGDENNPTTPAENATETPSGGPAPESGAAAETRPPAPSNAITDALRHAFQTYLDKSGAREQYGNEVNIDLDFLKQHAGPMFASMFQQLTSNIVPKDMKIGMPLPSADPTISDKPVAVNFDLGGIIQSFFTPRKPAEPPAPATKSEEPPKS